MKLESVKFVESIRFEGQEASFLKSDKCSLTLDEATGILHVKSSKDFVLTSLNNCVYWRPMPNEPKPEKK